MRSLSPTSLEGENKSIRSLQEQQANNMQINKTSSRLFDEWKKKKSWMRVIANDLLKNNDYLQ